MYRNYEEYEVALEKLLENAPKNVKIEKKTKEQFEHDNYRDKVEWYLMEEWNTKPLHEIFFGHIVNDDDDDSDEFTPEEYRAEELHGGVHDILDSCFEKGCGISQAAGKVFKYLKKQKAI
jgi:hypothetical protein